MINEYKQGLEDMLCNNDAMRKTQERDEDLQIQEEAWRGYERTRKAQEEVEKRNKKIKWKLV